MYNGYWKAITVDNVPLQISLYGEVRGWRSVGNVSQQYYLPVVNGSITINDYDYKIATLMTSIFPAYVSGSQVIITGKSPEEDSNG